MATALALRFPLGEYHATAWDRAVNSGDSEWPPSLWRILRALLSTWHIRCPQFTGDTVERVIGRLAGEPPSYLLPSVAPSHTRHYLPGIHHTAMVRDTAYTLAPRLQVSPDSRLIVHWAGVELDADDRHVLASQLKAMPYLGRAESICDGQLLEPSETPTVDETWTVPSDSGDDLRVLVPMPGVTRSQLEVTPDAMRKARRLMPVGSRWQGYRRGVVPEPPPAQKVPAAPTAVRWALGGPVAVQEVNGVLATGGLRRTVLYAFKRQQPDSVEAFQQLAGKQGGVTATDGHRHAHWLWLGSGGPTRTVSEVALWVPGGIPREALAAVVGVGRLPRMAEEPKGYVPAPIHLQAVGQAEHVLPELAGPSRRWRSLTPMLTDRHPKERRTADSFVRRELERELSYRTWGEKGTPTVVSVSVTKAWEDGEVTQYRRYRLTESMAQRRRGFTVCFELDREISGPVVLGALSHFGFGLFEPD